MSGCRWGRARARRAPAEDGKTWVCHRTESDKNPYNKNEVSSSSVEGASGHIGPPHEEDIVPPGPWGPGQNYNPDNGAIWLNECRNLTALPDYPTLTNATCSSGVVIPGSVTPTSTLGVRYTVAPPGPYDGTRNTTVTVTATLVLGYDWGPMPAGWTKVDDDHGQVDRRAEGDDLQSGDASRSDAEAGGVRARSPGATRADVRSDHGDHVQRDPARTVQVGPDGDGDGDAGAGLRLAGDAAFRMDADLADDGHARR